MKSINQKTYTRMFIALIIFCLCCVGLIVRVGYIKIVYGKEFAKKAKLQKTNFDYIIQPLRGSILDRNGNILAMSTKVYNIIFDPGVLSTLDKKIQKQTVEKLNNILGISKEQLNEYLLYKKDRHYIILQKKVSMELAEKIKEGTKEGDIKGVWLEEDNQRKYPYYTLGAHVIGFVGGGHGHWGIEETYDKWLQGTPGRKFVVYENEGLDVRQYINPVKGNTIILTIDEIIQHYVENVLKKYIEEQKPKNASAIIMNPQTGEVLAMANYPTFNLNDINQVIGYNGDVKIDEITEKEKINVMQSIWRNYAISDTYEPGSTFKPMVVAAAIEEDAVSTNDIFYCSGHKQVYDYNIHCWKRSGHGKQTLEEALANSCNVAMMDIGEKIGANIFYNYQRAFGFGQKTGIDLMGETDSASLVYTRKQLGPVELATSSFGQGFNVTPIQLINAFASIINGGRLLKPYVVKQMVDEQGTVIKENNTTLMRKVISRETSNILKDYLRSVVIEGTGKKAQIKGYDIGGKTGTAEKGKRGEGKYVVSFVGFAPVEDPKIIMMVLLDEPKDSQAGSGLAVEMAKEIFQDVLPYLDIYPNLNE